MRTAAAPTAHWTDANAPLLLTSGIESDGATIVELKLPEKLSIGQETVSSLRVRTGGGCHVMV
jgi:hypothetical protein